MSKRKELKSVAYAISGHFISRYNAINRYWAMGILYKQANTIKTDFLELNICNETIQPNMMNARETLTYFHDFLNKQLEVHKINKNILKSVIIEIKFNLVPTELEALYKNIYGNPFLCKVFITDNLNKIYMHERRSCCREHAPKREYQSVI